jgi:2-polyprenyl-3-methyl-5-hydroxy-6-metoxy-1,4-benzoquinol methylase
MEDQRVSQATLVRVPCPLCHGTRSRYERLLRQFTLERCLACGFVFMNPQYPLESLRDLYEQKETSRHIALYERIMTPAIGKELDRVLGQLAAHGSAGGRLLDFGCSAGYFVERAAAAGWEAHGLDLSLWVAEAGATRGVSNIHVGYLAEQNFDDDSFDVLYSSQVLEHLPQPKKELQELHRVLKPGGLFYANVPNYRCLSIVLGRDDFELNTPPQHVNYFTPATLRRLFEESGFEVLRTNTYGGLKWENLLGRPIVSDVANAYRAEKLDSAQASALAYQAANPSAAKRLAMPFVNVVLYKLAKVGMGLEIIARKRLLGASCR